MTEDQKIRQFVYLYLTTHNASKAYREVWGEPINGNLGVIASRMVKSCVIRDIIQGEQKWLEEALTERLITRFQGLPLETDPLS